MSRVGYDVEKLEYPLFDAYFDYIGESESPPTYIRWAAISGISAMMGRNVWFPFGDFRIFPNMYVKLIGDPGVRKSTAIKQMRKLLSHAGYSTFAGDKTSKEKFLLDLEGKEEVLESSTDAHAVMEVMFNGGALDQTPREVYVVADEFNEFVGGGNIDFLSLLGSLWDWDDTTRPFEQRFKNSKSIQIWQPTISIIGGNTHQNLLECFPPAAIGQGFMSRMLFIFSEGTGVKIPFPTKPADEQRTRVVDMLRKVRDELTFGEYPVEARAKEILGIIYRTWQPIDDARFVHYSSRRFTHLLKLCICCAAARFADCIAPGDVVMANTLLHRAEHYMPDALGEFGKAKNADVSSTVVNVLAKADKPMMPEEIWTRVRTNLDGIDALHKLLAGLQTAGKISYISQGMDRGYALTRRVELQSLYVERSWLRENIITQSSPY